VGGTFVTMTMQSGVTLRKMRITFTAPGTTTDLNSFMVRARPSADTSTEYEYQTVPWVNGTTAYVALLMGLPDSDSYEVGVASANKLNGLSSWVTATVSITTTDAEWSDVNLITNGEVQQGVLGGLPQSWTNAAGNLVVGKYTGGLGNVFKIVNASAASNSAYTNNFDVVAGRHYRFTVRIRLVSASGAAGSGAFLRLNRISGTMPTVKDRSSLHTLGISDTSDNIYLGVAHNDTAAASKFVNLHIVLYATAAATLRPYLHFGGM
jgi:hypothetical protein